MTWFFYCFFLLIRTRFRLCITVIESHTKNFCNCTAKLVLIRRWINFTSIYLLLLGVSVYCAVQYATSPLTHIINWTSNSLGGPTWDTEKWLVLNFTFTRKFLHLQTYLDTVFNLIAENVDWYLYIKGYVKIHTNGKPEFSF